MKDINLKLETNLKKFSALTLAETLWESLVIKDEIKSYGTSVFDLEGGNQQNELNWRNIVIKRVLDLLETLQIPDDLFSKVESSIVFIGEKILNWFMSFTKMMGPFPFDQIYLLKVCWTQHGVVDDWKLYQAWKKKPFGALKFLEPPYCDLPGSEYDIHKLLPYAIASTHADENFIRESLQKISILIKKVLGIKIKDLTKFKVSSAMVILLVWFKTVNNTNLQFNAVYSSLKSKEYPKGTDKMFLLCAKMGWKRAAEYFYGRLKDTDKQSMVQQALLECLSETFLNGQVVLHMSITEKTPEMVLYLLGKMTSEWRRIFLLDKVAEVYTCFLHSWPYQELCTPLLDYFWVDIQDASKVRILQALFTILKHNSGEKHYAFTSAIYHPLARDLLARTSHDLKKYIFLGSNITFNLFKIPDFASIDVILEDQDCQALRNEVIDIGKFLPGYWITKAGHTQQIKDYMNHLKMSSEERKSLLKSLKEPQLLYYVIKEGRFDEAEDLLEWSCESSEIEMLKVKSGIKKLSKAFCSEFVKTGKFDLIVKYFDWITDNEEELTIMKKEILTTFFIRDQFWIVWISNRKESLKSAQEKCTKFLKYFLKTDDKVNSFKKEKIMRDEGMVKSVLDAAENMDYYSNFTINFDEIVEFCSVPSEKVKDIKDKIFQKIVLYFKFIWKTEQFLMLNSLVNWFPEDRKKTMLKMLFVNETKILSILLISSKLAPYNEAMKEERKVLLLEWIKPYGDIEKLKKLLDKGKAKMVHESITEIDIQNAKEVLDLCKISSLRSLARNLDEGLL